jgi:hypothetical protein
LQVPVEKACPDTYNNARVIRNWIRCLILQIFPCMCRDLRTENKSLEILNFRESLFSVIFHMNSWISSFFPTCKR